MVRMTDISIMSGERTHARPRVHGVEPTWRSKFWASGEDIDSPADSEDEEAEQTPVNEAISKGFTVGHLRQAEEKLPSPPPGSTKVCTKLKEGSISKEIVELGVVNWRNKVKSWNEPLPSPRQSPLRTIGDAIANAKV
jgi:hypothetical protein